MGRIGEADVLSRVKNTSVDKLKADSVLYFEKGIAHLPIREKLPPLEDKRGEIWLLTQRFTHTLIALSFSVPRIYIGISLQTGFGDYHWGELRLKKTDCEFGRWKFGKKFCINQ